MNGAVMCRETSEPEPQRRIALQRLRQIDIGPARLFAGQLRQCDIPNLDHAKPPFLSV